MIWTKTDEATASSASIVATAMAIHVVVMQMIIFYCVTNNIPEHFEVLCAKM